MLGEESRTPGAIPMFPDSLILARLNRGTEIEVPSKNSCLKHRQNSGPENLKILTRLRKMWQEPIKGLVARRRQKKSSSVQKSSQFLENIWSSQKHLVRPKNFAGDKTNWPNLGNSAFHKTLNKSRNSTRKLEINSPPRPRFGQAR